MTIRFITCLNNAENENDLALWRELHRAHGCMLEWAPAEIFLHSTQEQQEKWPDACSSSDQEDLISYSYPVPLTPRLQYLLNAAPCVLEWDEVNE